jgi:hypothetical protein
MNEGYFKKHIMKYSAYLRKTSHLALSFMCLRNSAHDCHSLIVQGRVTRYTTLCFHTGTCTESNCNIVLERLDEVLWDEGGAIDSIVASIFANLLDQFAF